MSSKPQIINIEKDGMDIGMFTALASQTPDPTRERVEGEIYEIKDPENLPEKEAEKKIVLVDNVHQAPNEITVKYDDELGLHYIDEIDNRIEYKNSGEWLQLYEKTEKGWSPYQGPKGGQGWINSETGEVRYQDEPPSQEVGLPDDPTVIADIDDPNTLRSMAEDHDETIIDQSKTIAELDDDDPEYWNERERLKDELDEVTDAREMITEQMKVVANQADSPEDVKELVEYEESNYRVVRDLESRIEELTKESHEAWEEDDEERIDELREQRRLVSDQKNEIESNLREVDQITNLAESAVSEGEFVYGDSEEIRDELSELYGEKRQVTTKKNQLQNMLRQHREEARQEVEEEVERLKEEEGPEAANEYWSEAREEIYDSTDEWSKENIRPVEEREDELSDEIVSRNERLNQHKRDFFVEELKDGETLDVEDVADHEPRDMVDLGESTAKRFEEGQTPLDAAWNDWFSEPGSDTKEELLMLLHSEEGQQQVADEMADAGIEPDDTVRIFRGGPINEDRGYDSWSTSLDEAEKFARYEGLGGVDTESNMAFGLGMMAAGAHEKDLEELEENIHVAEVPAEYIAGYDAREDEVVVSPEPMPWTEYTEAPVEESVQIIEPSGLYKANWVPYEGPQGGEGWQNTNTGEVVYDDEPPGGVDVDPDDYFEASHEELFDAIEAVTGEDMSDDWSEMSAEEIRQAIQEMASPEELAEVMEELNNESDESDDSGTDPSDYLHPDRTPYDTGGYLVDTQFGGRVADAVKNGNVVEEISAGDWQSYSGLIEDEDLLLDALNQVFSNSGTATAKTRIQGRLRGLGMDQEQIDDYVRRKPKPDGDSYDTSEQIENGIKEIATGNSKTERREQIAEVWERAETQELENIIDSIGVGKIGDDLFASIIHSEQMGYNLGKYSNENLGGIGTNDQVNELDIDTIVNAMDYDDKKEFFNNLDRFEIDDAEIVQGVKAMLWYRDDGSIDDIEELVDIKVDEDDELIQETKVETYDGMSDALNKMDPALGIQAMKSLRQIDFGDYSTRSWAGRYQLGNIKIDASTVSSRKKTAAHELGHHVHNQLGLSKKTGSYPDSNEWREFDRDDAVFGVDPDDSEQFDDLKKVAKSWENYESGHVSEIRQYQRRHGIEYLAVSFAHWATDEAKLQGRDPYMKEFWDKHASGADTINEIDDIGEGDEIILHNKGHKFPKVYEVDDVGGDEGWSGAPGEWTLKPKHSGGTSNETIYEAHEDVVEFFQQGVKQ